MYAFYELIPILVFFATYKMVNLYAATYVLIFLSLFILLWGRIKNHKFSPKALANFALASIMGGLTLYSQNEIFIKWKPTLLYLFLFIACFYTHFTHKTLLEHLGGKKIKLPHLIWKKLNLAFMLFFICLGFANLWAAYTFDTNTWMYFKLFGTTIMTFIFMIGLGIYLKPHIINDKS